MDILVAQLAEEATPLSLDLNGPFDDLTPLANRVRGAKVVGLGSALRQSHELSTLTHRVMRFLIEQHGFRSLALEGDGAASVRLDAYVHTGEGDPREILATARSFLRFSEILDAVRWIRERNERNPSDHVRVVYVTEQPHEDLEEWVADTTAAWHEQTGHSIVYWGGMAHTVTGVVVGRSAGSHLRERFGSGYVSTGLTFHHGLIPSRLDPPPDDYAETVLGAVDLDTYLLEVHGNCADAVREWLDAPAKIRLIGPGTHELLTPSLRSWFDFIIHSRRITPAHAL